MNKKKIPTLPLRRLIQRTIDFKEDIEKLTIPGINVVVDFLDVFSKSQRLQKEYIESIIDELNILEIKVELLIERVEKLEDDKDERK